MAIYDSGNGPQTLQPFQLAGRPSGSGFALPPATPPPPADAILNPQGIIDVSNPSNIAKGYVNQPPPATPGASGYRYITPGATPTPGTAFDANTETSRYLSTLEDTANQPTDEASIRAKQITDAQNRIDGINQYYTNLSNQKTAENRATGDKLNQEVRAGNIRSGNMGSDFATANSVGQEKSNQTVIDNANADIESQRQNALSGLYDRIDQNVQAEAQARRAEALGARQSLVDFMNKQATEVKADRQATVSRLGALGTTIDQLKQTPDYYQQILKDTGYSEAELQYELNKAKPVAQQTQYKTEVTSDGKILMYGVDPTTGKLSYQTVDTNVPDGMTPVMKEGTLYYQDQNGNLSPAPIGSANQTPDIKNYQFAKSQGYGGSFLDWQHTSANLKDNLKTTGGTTPGGTVAGGAGNGAGAPTTTGSIAQDTQAVLEGRNTLYNIRQTMGRTNAAAEYMRQMRAAITKEDPSFDFVASDAGGKAVSSTYYQKSLASINSVLPNIDKIVDLSNQVSRVGITGVDKLLQSGQIIINNQKVSNFHEAQKLIADEIGVALGAGTVSDMKLQLGYDVTNPAVSADVFASNMNLIKDFIQNRKAGLEQLRYKSTTTNQDVVNIPGIPNDVSTGIKADISAGHTLEDIRQNLRSQGIDPQVLDTYMRSVDPANNTPRQTSSASSPTLASANFNSVDGFGPNTGIPATYVDRTRASNLRLRTGKPTTDLQIIPGALDEGGVPLPGRQPIPKLV